MMGVSRDMPILIVDDYKTMLRIVRGLLEQLGFHEIQEATDGQTAYDVICSTPVSLVISDWNMQPVTGLDLLKKVRANPAVRGGVHAWVGLVCGAIFGLFNMVLLGISIVGFVMGVASKL